MKQKPIALCLLTALTGFALEPGASRSATIAELGEPSGVMKHGSKETLLYPAGTVIIENGIAAEINLSQKTAQESRERLEKATEALQLRKEELRKMQKTYPEDRLTETECTYSKNEAFSHLPPAVLPRAGIYRCAIYIPIDYYRNETRTVPCLFLENPDLWPVFAERVRAEKWMAVVLPFAPSDQPGSFMNSSFLAACDEVTSHFRASPQYRFTAGGVPSALYATLRPTGGIILHEPDFRGIAALNLNIDFLNLNPELRAYVLLSRSNTANMHYQAQFVTRHIPRRSIKLLENPARILPGFCANEAISWLKKEYQLP